MESSSQAPPVAEAIKAAFNAWDVDGNGVLSRKEVETVFKKFGTWTDTDFEHMFAIADKNGNGVVEYNEFVDWIFGEPARTVSNCFWSNSEYCVSHSLGSVFEEMAKGLDAVKPHDPYLWMIRFLAGRRQHQFDASSAPQAHAASRNVEGDRTGTIPKRVNTSACLKKACKPLLDIVLEEAAWEQVEDPNDIACDIYFVWSGQALLSRFAHPSVSDKSLPQLPPGSWVNRFPGMGCLCDKVNMALALRLLQKLWPAKFRFWPQSWLLPAETDQLYHWLETNKGDTVIVKPEAGSQGEGIFLVRSASDLEVKLSAKPHWGSGFGALAQRYLPNPLLLDGLKFDLRLYVVVTSLDPLQAFLCKEGLARFCTSRYEAPTQANANDVYMHLTNYSLNKKSKDFKDEDPFDVNTTASKRPMATLLAQIAAQEATQGRMFDEAALFSSFEEVSVILLQAIAPVLNVTYERVTAESTRKPKTPKAQPKSKSKSKARRNDGDDEIEDDFEDGDEFEPNCFQVLGVDVLLDENLQPWLLEVNARPSMDISNPIRLDAAPAGAKRCTCRDMDGEAHAHVQSEIDVHVKRLVIAGAFQLLSGSIPGTFLKMDFDRHSPSDAQETLQACARIYRVAGGTKKAFTTSGLRRAMAGALGGTTKLKAHDLDTLVTKWKYQGYRQEGNIEEDKADLGVLDFAGLLQEVACMRAPEEDSMEALGSLLGLCDPLE